MSSSFNRWHELIELQANKLTNKTAYIFLQDGETEKAWLTYGELWQKARAIAALLQEYNVKPGDRVLITYPPGLDFIYVFYGCLISGVISVPTYPAKNIDGLRLVANIFNNAKPKLIFTQSNIAKTITIFSEHFPALSKATIIATDTLELKEPAQFNLPYIALDDVAFLQYSSGATSLPKGVMYSHGNLLQHADNINKMFPVSETEVGVSWLPQYHDLGFLVFTLQTIFIGWTSISMSPLSFIVNPLRLLKAITRYQATVSGGPNFCYELCIKAAEHENLTGLDLSSWRIAFNAAEPVQANTLTKFSHTFAPYGFDMASFSPGYGLSESVLVVTSKPFGKLPQIKHFDRVALTERLAIVTQPEEGQALVSNGFPLGQQQVIIVDPATCTPCAENQIGEIWIKGPCVTKGYWDQPELTAKTFQAYLKPSNEGPYLRSNDLGFIADNELYFVGRLQDLLVIDGRNYYPQNIELTVEKAHPAIKQGSSVAFSIEEKQAERLIIVAELNKLYLQAEMESIMSVIAKAVTTDHGLSAYSIVLLKPGGMFKTTSGKLQRQKCRQAFFDKQLNIAYQWSSSQTKA